MMTKNTVNNYLICCLFLFGIFLPASVGGQITSAFGVFSSFVSLACLFVLLFRQSKLDLVNLFLGLAFGVAITAFTFSSRYYAYKYGTGLLFITLFSMLLINSNDNPKNLKSYLTALVIADIYLITLSLGIIFQIPSITEIIRQYYSAFYPELIPNMLFQLKPVAIFATHSVAGFYDFLFLLLNLMAFKHTHQKKYLLATLLFLVFLFFLQSSTSLTMLILSLVVLQVELYRYNRHFAYLIYGLEILALLIMLPFANDLVDSVVMKMFSHRNGLGGRYSDGGNLANNLEYILNNPLSGIGFGYTTDFMYADSGYLEYSLRNSVLGTIAIICAFTRFIFRNLQGKFAYVLTIVYLIFEIGFSNLIYSRMLPITLFAIAFFNQLQRQEKQNPKAMPQRGQIGLTTN